MQSSIQPHVPTDSRMQASVASAQGAKQQQSHQVSTSIMPGRDAPVRTDTEVRPHAAHPSREQRAVCAQARRPLKSYSPGTPAGSSTARIEPSPSSPLVLCPQHCTRSSLNVTHALQSAMATLVTPDVYTSNGRFGTGSVSESPLVPITSRRLPQQVSRPPARIADTNVSPVLIATASLMPSIGCGFGSRGAAFCSPLNDLPSPSCPCESTPQHATV